MSAVTDTDGRLAAPDLTDQQRDALRARGIPDELHARFPFAGTGLADRMGIVFTELTVDRCVATMPVDGNTQPVGLLHGGAHVVLAETLGSTAASLWAGPGVVVVGTDVNATHHRGIRNGVVVGTATPLHLGRTMTTHEVVMTDEAGRRLSTARITNLIRR
ncbi:hotdog fold thioesterase [Tersicoccus phoenicis]|uniref:hotdog fold thioesterase n=1 Tax=Tersicoccus phoenicis TaxID=554083 RepID=UPI000A02C0C7|nr:hotdog fold thioesterase [Tersicoccus phoenicis]